jgi:hypothetical protein
LKLKSPPANKLLTSNLNPVKMLASIGIELPLQRIHAFGEPLRRDFCMMLIQLLACLDPHCDQLIALLKQEGYAIGCVRVIENILLVLVPTFYPELKLPLVRVIRWMIEFKIAPYMARNRLEVAEFFLVRRQQKVLGKLNPNYHKQKQEALESAKMERKNRKLSRERRGAGGVGSGNGSGRFGSGSGSGFGSGVSGASSGSLLGEGRASYAGSNSSSENNSPADGTEALNGKSQKKRLNSLDLDARSPNANLLDSGSKRERSNTDITADRTGSKASKGISGMSSGAENNNNIPDSPHSSQVSSAGSGADRHSGMGSPLTPGSGSKDSRGSGYSEGGEGEEHEDDPDGDFDLDGLDDSGEEHHENDSEQARREAGIPEAAASSRDAESKSQSATATTSSGPKSPEKRKRRQLKPVPYSRRWDFWQNWRRRLQNTLAAIDKGHWPRQAYNKRQGGDVKRTVSKKEARVRRA